MTLMNRRTVMKGGAALAIAASLPAVRRTARADENPSPRNLIVVWLGGGWDTTYVFDPKPGLMDVDAPAGKITSMGALTLYTDASRPKVTSFFEKYGAVSAIINGIQLEAINHPECTLQMLTGTRDRAAPDFAAIAAHELGNDLPLPYLISAQVAFTGPLTSSAGRIGAKGQLVRLLDPAKAGYRSAPGAPQIPAITPDADRDGLIASFVRARANRFRALPERVSADRTRIDDFLESFDRGDALKPHTKALNDFLHGDPTLDGQLRAALTAINSGVSRAVIVGDHQNWDTHTGNKAQGDYLENVFPSLEALAKALDDQKLLDRTVVAVLSEMGRTPKLNQAQGKDHWPVTSALVFGGGVRSGVYGATDDGLRASMVDLSSGAAASAGTRLKSDNVLAGILQLLGVDPSSHLPGVEVFAPFAT